MTILVHDNAFSPFSGDANGVADTAVYKTLLESTQAIPWRIDWATMQFTYIGPQIEKLLGWSQDSWVTVQDWATRIHEDDRERVVNFCVSQSQAGIDHEADYRALTASGGTVWIRDVVHVVRKPDGSVDSLIGFMFDISERKRTEERVLELQKKLEILSYTDSLTGIANRRSFDTRLENEWKNARRSEQPLSLLVIDVDYFKQYNDFYGHTEGDACLVQIAQALHGLAKRPRDLAARLGGEEFALLLPETDAEGAQRSAQLCADAIATLRLPHERSEVSSIITVSLGVGTITVGGEGRPQEFVEAVDHLLYAAKRNGRNRFEWARMQQTGFASISINGNPPPERQAAAPPPRRKKM
ncbi:sensor domain-containing diguanylate cyclase [Sphingomonas sp. KC8]|uniref:sensor domain-containing diguanylate cyclase n=1 Tax=Sphingomonas sp. KC8 TaxID=1030157 RepID=UPI00024885D4|nr:sensor domain-containing diguanylate cyclase [Sphingomonas sp. KC8]ARS25815.1 diguanylate cyclase [Sphingomonas sp. KC8]